ncbi:hypothetical protein [Lacticaseibacillus brantae]|uniref:Uncharacterized protein n=1 Tax=Lacticaseibacillus brantae DSM 23927 TaxID=1423727 RepID=A0A0R2B6I4_9LACO|nr:hypothetical protein [Lacticaseibacillus brantae]KRM71702.1 hypothetical protein FC34_GL001359 [Lacticaseibacillus brantae DSM 23927]
MDAILMSLMAAFNERLLINVYQRDTDDFYTGYVQMMGPNSVILGTYSDAGIADGSVLIAFSAIDQVEFAGDDLENMTFRIEVAEDEHFLSIHGQEAALKFNPKSDLMPQLAGQVQASGQMVMVILADDDAYLEGQITALAEDRFTLAVFNKFNYTDIRYLQVDFSDVLVIEFQGLDLYLETLLVKSRDHLKHVKTILHQNDGQLPDVMRNAQAAQTVVSVVPKDREDNFYVGTIKAVTDELVVLKLKDRAAQFGGYAAIRFRAIQNVVTASDYLQTMAFYEQWDIAHQFTQQPVLNADREFEASDDLMTQMISELAVDQQVMRIRVADAEDHLIGYPSDVTGSSFTLNLIEDDLGETVTVMTDSILEMAFGHIYAYLQAAQLHSAD